MRRVLLSQLQDDTQTHYQSISTTEAKRKNKSEGGFDNIISNPASATPMTRVTKQPSFSTINKLITNPELRRSQKFTEESGKQHKLTTTTSNFHSLTLKHKLTYMARQNIEYDSLQPGSQTVELPTNRIQYSAKAVNYNNFIKRFSEKGDKLLNPNLAIAKGTRSVVVSAFGPVDRMFVIKHPIKAFSHKTELSGDERTTSRLRESVMTVSKCKTQQITPTRRGQPSDKEMRKFKNFYNHDVESLIEMRLKKQDPNAIYKRLHIEDVEYTDQRKAIEHPINIALFNMLKEEEIALKQRLLDEHDMYSPQELQARRAETERINESTKKEYRRKAYIDQGQIISITEKYRNIREAQKRRDSVLPMRVSMMKVTPMDPLKVDKRRKILNEIVQYLYKIRELHLTIKDIMKHKVFPTKAYEHPRSQIFMDMIKNDNRHAVSEELSINRYLVYQFDSHNLTPLHHAVIRNHYRMVWMLLEYNADVNSKDIIGRIPLFFAVRAGASEMVTLLLYFKALPWSNAHNPYDAHLHKLTDKCRDQFRKARNLHLQMKITKYSQRDAFWKERRYYFAP